MPDENILESYFVKVGAAPDLNSFKDLGKALWKAGLNVATFSENSANAIAELGVQTVKTAATVSLNLIKMADSTAQVDQSYRLLGMRMLMTKESFRAMQMTLDQMGVTINEVAMDLTGELAKRFQYLNDENLRLGVTLGTSFDEITRRMRLVRDEATRFGNELQIGMWSVITKTFEKLGYSEDDVLNKFKDFNNYVVDHIPEWTQDITNALTPAWQDFVSVVKEGKSDLKEFGKEYIHLTGILQSDKELENADVNIKNLTKATSEWVDTLTKQLLQLGLTFKAVMHGMEAIQDWANAYLNLKLTPEQAAPYKKRAAEEYAAFDAISEYMLHGVATPETQQSSDFAAIVEFERRRALRDVSPNVSLDRERYLDQNIARDLRSSALSNKVSRDVRIPPQYRDLVYEAARANQLDPNLLAAVIHAESGWNPGLTSYAGAQGLGQLMPGTAREMGVTNVWDPRQNIFGTAGYLKKKLDMYHGDTLHALSAYNEGSAGLDNYARINKILERYDELGLKPGDRALDREMAKEVIGLQFRSDKAFNTFEDQFTKFARFKSREGLTYPDIPSPEQTQHYVRSIMREYRQDPEWTRPDVNIQSIIINVPKSIPDKDWHEVIADSLVTYTRKQERNKQAQTAGGAFH